jgi:hypothetical protein
MSFDVYMGHPCFTPRPNLCTSEDTRKISSKFSDLVCCTSSRSLAEILKINLSVVHGSVTYLSIQTYLQVESLAKFQ